MTLKLNALEHTALLVAAAGAGALALPHVLWIAALAGGVVVAGVSFGLRQGWKPSL